MTEQNKVSGEFRAPEVDPDPQWWRRTLRIRDAELERHRALVADLERAQEDAETLDVRNLLDLLLPRHGFGATIGHH